MSGKAMPIIDELGHYVYVDNTKKIQTSNHPVYRARIEIALGQGQWIGAPKAGHQLARFGRVRQSQHQIEEFEKALAFYLSRYSPEVVDTLVTRQGVTTDLKIKQGALDVVV
jgi:hypothetical protein